MKDVLPILTYPWLHEKGQISDVFLEFPFLNIFFFF